MRRAVRVGEALAIDPRAVLSSGPDAFFMLFESPVRKNEFKDDIGIVTITGPLEHHACSYGDSYEAICQRAQWAFEGQEDGDDNKDDQHGKPKAVVLRIDSPGGVVSGLNQTVRKLRAMSKEAGIPLIAAVDEMAASAAYALACACSDIFVPPSAITGSVGVISTLADQTVADAKAGIRVVTITSGARKSDGHPHVEISDRAIQLEQSRVDKLAKQFFKLVKQARGLSLKAIETLQAGIFLGGDAVNVGLADGVRGFEGLMSYLADPNLLASYTNHGNIDLQTARMQSAHNQRAGTMALALAALVAKTEKALASEKDPARRLQLEADLVAYKKTKHVIEKHESEEGADEDEEEAEGNETDRGDDPEDDEDAEDDDDDKDEEKSAAKGESEEEEAKAILAMLTTASGGAKSLSGSLAALLAKAKSYDALEARVSKQEAETKAARKATSIAQALAERKITPGEAKMLRKEKESFVASFLRMRPKAIINLEGEELPVPNGQQGAELSADAMRIIDQAVMASAGKITREQLISAHREGVAKINGAGRY